MNLIRPEEVEAIKAKSIPQSVFDAFNEIIVKHWDGRASIFTTEEVVQHITKKARITSDRLYANHWLDVEQAYREVGWVVEFDKPGFNENGASTYEFRKQK